MEAIKLERRVERTPTQGLEEYHLERYREMISEVEGLMQRQAEIGRAGYFSRKKLLEEQGKESFTVKWKSTKPVDEYTQFVVKSVLKCNANSIEIKNKKLYQKISKMASKINIEQYLSEIKRRMSLNIDEDIMIKVSLKSSNKKSNLNLLRFVMSF